MNIASNTSKLINKKKWQEYKNITAVFKKKISLDNYDINTQKNLWKYIVENRNKIKEKIMKAIRVLTAMCCDLDEEEQIKKLNYPLFEFNYLFDHKFYDFSDYDYEGLKKFLKILKSTFGNTETFIYKFKRVKSILSFVEEGRDRILVNEYNYLKNISLPISGYESLRMDLITILKKYNQLMPVISQKKNYNEFKQDIQKFKKVYIIEYQKRHLFYQNKIDYLKRKIFTLPSYRVLNKLSNITGLEKKETIEYIDSFFENKCNKDNINRILLKQPKCNCGFTIGENLTIPSLDKIKPMLREAIESYIDYLKSKLKKYYRQNPDSSIKRIYNIDNIKHMEGTELINIIDEKLINEINCALGNKNTIKIYINEIITKMAGTYSIEDINSLADSFKERLLTKINDCTGNIDKKNVIIKIEKKT